MKFRVGVIFFLSLCAFSKTYAQQDPQFSQYMFNKMLLNPAGAGSKGRVNVNAYYRAQWVNLKGAPTTIGILADAPIAGKGIGIGLAVFETKTANLKFTRVNTNYSYKIRIQETSSFTFGLQAGVVQYSVNTEGLILRDPIEEDQTFSANNLAQIIPDFGFGVMFRAESFFLGLSIPHLLQSKVKFLNSTIAKPDSTKDIYARVFRHYYLTGGYTIPINYDLSIQPSFILRYVQGAPISSDVNVNASYKNLIWAGAGIRTSNSKALILILGLNAGKAINQQILFGYSYDATIDKTAFYGGATHEIMVNYMFKPSATKRKSNKPFFIK